MRQIKVIVSFLLIAHLVLAQSAGKEIESLLDARIEQNTLPGVVTIVAQKDKIIQVNNSGFQDIGKKKKMTPDALFWIASQSKPITGTAVMMLVDEGKLNLDEPITTYLPELKKLMLSRVVRDGWQVEETVSVPVTLRHLLSHTSGMKWVASVQSQIGKIDVLPFNLSLYVTAITPLDFEPGGRYSYSNQGINIAATIVERVSGIPFEDFLQKRLFNPLGMKSATFWPTDEELKKLAIPYMITKDGKLEETTIDQLQYPLSDKTKRYPEAAGGLFCTPNDLVKFYQMIANKGVYKGKRYLSETSVTEMGKKQTGNLPEYYGLGWGGSADYMDHGGAYGTYTRVYKENGLIMMYFIQQTNISTSEELKESFLNLANRLYNK